MIYVSGRVDVNNFEHFRNQFEDAKEYLISGGNNDSAIYDGDKNVITIFETLNIMSTAYGGDVDAISMSEEVDMRLDHVRDCDILYLLIGWESDDMCRLEQTYAKAKGKRVIYSKKF